MLLLILTPVLFAHFLIAATCIDPATSPHILVPSSFIDCSAIEFKYYYDTSGPKRWSRLPPSTTRKREHVPQNGSVVSDFEYGCQYVVTFRDHFIEEIASLQDLGLAIESINVDCILQDDLRAGYEYFGQHDRLMVLIQGCQPTEGEPRCLNPIEL